MTPTVIETIIIGSFGALILALFGWGSYKSRQADTVRDGVISQIVKDLKELTEKIHSLAEKLGEHYLHSDFFRDYCVKAAENLASAVADRKSAQIKIEKDLQGLGDSMRQLREKIIRIETQHKINHGQSIMDSQDGRL